MLAGLCTEHMGLTLRVWSRESCPVPELAWCGGTAFLGTETDYLTDKNNTTWPALHLDWGWRVRFTCVLGVASAHLARRGILNITWDHEWYSSFQTVRGCSNITRFLSHTYSG